MNLVVCAPRQLNETAAAKILAVRWPLIAEIAAEVILRKRRPSRRSVERRLKLTQRREVSGLRTDSREGHQHHVLVAESGSTQCAHDERKVGLDVGDIHAGKHLLHLRNRYRRCGIATTRRNSGTDRDAADTCA